MKSDIILIAGLVVLYVLLAVPVESAEVDPRFCISQETFLAAISSDEFTAEIVGKEVHVTDTEDGTALRWAWEPSVQAMCIQGFVEVGA